MIKGELPEPKPHLHRIIALCGESILHGLREDQQIQQYSIGVSNYLRH